MKNKKAKKKQPILGPAEREDEHGEPLFHLTNASCPTECTGLIQVPPETDEELEHYNRIYNFTPTAPDDEKGRYIL